MASNGEIPITYRFRSRNRLPECPGEKPLRVIERNLAADAVRQRVKRVFRPWNLQEHGHGACLTKAEVEFAAEARRHDVVAATIYQQGGRKTRRNVGDGRRLLIFGKSCLRAAAQ